MAECGRQAMPRCRHKVYEHYPGECSRERSAVRGGRGKHMNRFPILLEVSWQEYLETHLPNHKIQSVKPQTQSCYVSRDWSWVGGKVGSPTLVLTPGSDLLRLCPRMFGHPNHRQRSWRIVYDNRRKTWGVKYSLEELSRMILAPQDCLLKLSAKAYLVATQKQLQSFPVHEHQLSRSMFAKKRSTLNK